MHLLKAEIDIKKSQEEFDQQVEITKLLLEGISSSQVSLFCAWMENIYKCIYKLNIICR